MIKGLLQDLPILQALDLLTGRLDDARLSRVLGRLARLVENSEIAGEGFIGELVGGISLVTSWLPAPR